MYEASVTEADSPDASTIAVMRKRFIPQNKAKSLCFVDRKEGLLKKAMEPLEADHLMSCSFRSGAIVNLKRLFLAMSQREHLERD